ncbi:hypothetical protein MN086_00135 [Sulfurovum sp. XGS-02]|uniref:hypothetical protein n=1 Tax=Sulfurovum sp. XGS-02 TaxID=2925411 RepID=UPI00205D5830|nr:hypothetical protein [Sulfurovum sp. XGS-02]UPT77580.1 hypothetical protein MN086_00135 [Sulfurovum sp. XGS-02]
MGNNKELLLVHPSMKTVSLTEAVNVMLPPQFYTLKKEALPLRYAYQAKRIAPSLFDGLLEAGNYEYMVWKEDEAWVFLAYDIEKITAFLESKGFVLEHVSKLFFAQQSIDLFNQPLLLGEDDALVALDGTVVVVPKEALAEEDTPSLRFDNRFTPKKGIMLSGAYGSVLSLKQASMLAAIFILFALMFFVEGSRYGDDSQAGEAKMQELLSAYPALQSTYTRESIMTKYKAIDTIERKKREIVKMVSGMIFKGVTLSSLEIDANRYKIHFACKNAQVAKRLNQLAAKNKLKTSAVAGSHDLKIEGTL